MTSSPFITAPETVPAYLIPKDKRDQPKFLAELFCGLDSEAQAVFFDRIAEIDEENWDRRGVFQWRAMQKELSPRAKRTIDDLKNHTDEGDDE